MASVTVSVTLAPDAVNVAVPVIVPPVNGVMFAEAFALVPA